MRYRKSLGTSDWDRAERRIRILEAGGDLAPDGGVGSHDLAHATKAFLQDCTNRNLKASTIVSYRETFEHLDELIGGGRALSSINAEALSGYRAKRNIKPITWRKELVHIRILFNFAVSRKMLTENPAQKRYIRLPCVEELVTLPFTREESSRLIDACNDFASNDPGATPYVRARARALVYVLLYSGLRIGDVVRLRRSALDPATRHLTLHATQKTGVPIKVLLHPDAAQALEHLPAQHPDYFFWNGRGDPDHYAKAMRRTIRRLGALAEVGNAHPHRFRDTFAVELLSNGADIRTVQKLLGHTSVRTTERHYAHFIAAHQQLLDTAAATLDFRDKPRRPIVMHARQNARRNA